MQIRYASRSKFIDACEAVIREHQSHLAAKTPVRVKLEEPGGYDGRVIVNIDSKDRDLFGTDWEGTDPTRFPARIKAAATALLNCRCDGRFEILHSDGSLNITRL